MGSRCPVLNETMSEAESESVISREDLQFNLDTYAKFLKLFDMLEGHMGIKLYLHAEHETLEQGQIFLFNHFARFETVIPVYLFYKHLRSFTRTIADYHLFQNEKLGRFLRGAGAVPNDMHGLLPFLAAELLKGRKVVIFPEGRMIKSKQVIDEEGQFGIFSHSLKSFRKHHTGAAVLALTLDLFKHRIKELFKAGDQVRLDHWCQALGFKEHEQLWLSVEKPTLIVPGTITFSPIRLGSNVFSKAVKLFSGEISPRALEEIIIEGNILFKDTDMDIRLGEPIQAHHKWSWWEDRLVKSYFLSITSLDEFFSLKKRTETWSERLLGRVIYRETNKIRDAYIKGIYKGVTINIAHIASVLIFTYLERNQEKVGKEEFHRALYLTVKELQNLPDVHLHYSLLKPELYRQLLDGEGTHLTQFFHTTTQTNLVTRDENFYTLSDRILQEHEKDAIRLENPVQVNANEVAPIAEVKISVMLALDMATENDPRGLAYKRWDDELRDFAWETEKYNKPKFNELNQYETAHSAREPYLLIHREDAPGVLLIHGFIASPPELLDYGEHLYKQGFNVLGMRLSGHGTSPYDLNTRSWEDWYASVKRNFEILSALSSGVFLLGFSTGGSLGLLLASEQPAALRGMASVCSAVKLQDKKLYFAPFLDRANRVAKVFPKVDGIMNYRKSNTQNPDTNYQHIPISALSELFALTDRVIKKLPRVKTPLLIVQSDGDPVVEPESAEIIHEKVASTDKKLHCLHSDQHHIIRRQVGDTLAELDAFFIRQKDKLQQESP